MFKFDGKECRNLQEQVGKNELDIKEHLDQINVLNQFGIKIIEQVLNTEELNNLPTDNLEFGDGVAVGDAAPYDFYIWTRGNNNNPDAHWFNIGLFPLPGPESTVPGPKGDQGNDGSRGTNIYAKNSNTPPEGRLIDGDIYLNTLDGKLREYRNGNWIEVGSIRGPAGKDGSDGTDGISISDITSNKVNDINYVTITLSDGSAKQFLVNDGEPGKPVEIVGTISLEDLELIDPSSVPRNTSYLVPITESEGANPINYLYVIVEDQDSDVGLKWYPAGPVTGATGDTGATPIISANDEYITSTDPNTGVSINVVAKADLKGADGPRGFGWYYTTNTLNQVVGESTSNITMTDQVNGFLATIDEFVIDPNGFYGVITDKIASLTPTFTVRTLGSLKGSDGATGRAGTNIFRADSYNTYSNNQYDSVVFSSLKGYDSTTGKFSTSIGGSSAVSNQKVRIGDLIYYAGNDAKISTRITESGVSTKPHIYLRRGSLLPIYQLDPGARSDYSSYGAGFMTAYLNNRSATNTANFALADIEYTTVNYCFDGNRSFNLNLTFGSDDTQNIYATTDENVFYIKKGDIIIDNRGSTALVTGGYFTSNPTIDYATPSQAYITVSIINRVPETYTRTNQINRTYTVYPDGFKELDMRFIANSTEQTITLPFNASFSNYNNVCILTGNQGARLQTRAWLSDATTLHVQTDSSTEYTISVLIRGY